MFRIIFPVLLGFCLFGSFTACGGGSADDLAEQQAELDEREALIDEIRELQKKQSQGTLTAAEEARLAELYALLDEEGENPGGGN